MIDMMANTTKGRCRLALAVARNVTNISAELTNFFTVLERPNFSKTAETCVVISAKLSMKVHPIPCVNAPISGVLRKLVPNKCPLSAERFLVYAQVQRCA